MHKKYSRSLIILRLNHWYHMNYFGPYYLSGPWTCQLHCCQWGVRKLSSFIKNILICVSKMNKGSYGFGTIWGWVIIDRIHFLGVNYPPYLSHVLVHYLNIISKYLSCLQVLIIRNRYTEFFSVNVTFFSRSFSASTYLRKHIFIAIKYRII